jgi:hypothetical protein
VKTESHETRKKNFEKKERKTLLPRMRRERRRKKMRENKWVIGK